MWFWRSDAGAKLAKTLTRLADDGGNKAWSPGRSRISRNPIAQGRPDCPARTCGSCPVQSFTHGGHGCERHPAFPAPSSIDEGLGFMHPSGAMRRESAEACPHGCLKCSNHRRRHCERSEAIQDHIGSLSSALDCFASLAMTTTKSGSIYQAIEYERSHAVPCASGYIRLRWRGLGSSFSPLAGSRRAKLALRRSG